MAVAAAPYWFVIVQPERPETLVRLRRFFQECTLVEVLTDRRRGDRRRALAPVATDRRRGDRRRPGPGAVSGKYRLFERGDGFAVFQCDGRVATQCPDCGWLVDFEMPRFSEVPARLDLRVLHTEHGGTVAARIQHTVEAQAFRRSGRPFLACRMTARRHAVATPPLFGLS